MASKDKILNTLAQQSGPITLTNLGKILGEPPGNFYTQLARFAKGEDALVRKTEDQKSWEITDKGREYLENLNNEQEAEDAKPPAEILRNSEDPTAVMTEYQKFYQLGLQAGVNNKPLLKATVDHVWAFDYHDLEAVHAALLQANIQPDIAQRWVAFWGSYIKKAITPTLEENMHSAKTGLDGIVTQGKGLRADLTHMLDTETDIPIYVGEGLGTMTYKDAIELAKIRAAGKARASSQQVPQGDAVDTALRIVEIINAKKEEGAVQPGKNYMVKVGADGQATLEEMDQGKPMIVQAGPTAPPLDPMASLSSQAQGLKGLIELLSSLGLVRLPGQDNGGGGQPVKYVMVNPDGSRRELAPGEPIIIQAPAPQVIKDVTPSNILLPGKDGQPGMTLDIRQLDAYFKIQDWQDKRRREEESHNNHQELIKTVKEMAPEAIKGFQDWASSQHGTKQEAA